MYNFLVVVGAEQEGPARAALIDAVELVSSTAPALTEHRLSHAWFPEVRGGWCVQRPARAFEPDLIQESIDDALAILVFGEIDGQRDSAGAVRRAFSQGGIAEVEHLGGRFAATIIDRLAARVYVTTDLIGQRGPFYYQRERELWLSPLSLTLLATGVVPLEWDRVSAAATVVGDWSVGGRGLVRGVDQHRPSERREWSREQGPLRARLRRLPSERLDARDHAGIRRQIDETLAVLRQSAAAFAASQSELYSQLTAGLDSRVVCALLASVEHPQRWLTTTSGAEQSEDVRVARRLASLVGATHQRLEPETPSAKDFYEHATLRAIYANGACHAGEGLMPMPRYAPEAPIVTGGMGGEIFRGFFYQYFGLRGVVPNRPDVVLRTLERFRYRRRKVLLASSSPELWPAVRERVSQTLTELAEFSREGADVLDSFYLFERFGRWASLVPRMTWLRNWTPFSATGAVAAAFRLPAPIGKRCHVHALAIERYLPEARWMSINGASFVPLERSGAVRFAARQLLNLQAKARARLAKKSRASSLDYVSQWAALVKSDQELRGVVRDLLAAPSSSFVELIGGASAERLLAEHDRQLNQLPTMAYAMSVELWRRAASKVLARAAENAAARAASAQGFSATKK